MREALSGQIYTVTANLSSWHMWITKSLSSFFFSPLREKESGEIHSCLVGSPVASVLIYSHLRLCGKQGRLLSLVNAGFISQII